MKDCKGDPTVWREIKNVGLYAPYYGVWEGVAGVWDPFKADLPGPLFWGGFLRASRLEAIPRTFHFFIDENFFLR